MSREKKVGLTVLVSLACLGGLVVFLGKLHLNSPGFPVKVAFNYVDSLKTDAPVLYGGGVKVGVVDSIDMEDGKVQVLLHIYMNSKIPKDSKFTIHTSGILGEKYVQVNAGNIASGLLEARDGVIGIDPGSLDRTLQRVEALTDFLAPLLEDPKFKSSFSKIMGNIEGITEQLSSLIEDSSGDIRTSVKNLKELSGSLKARVDDMKGIVDSAKGMLNEENKKNLQHSLSKLDATLTKLDRAMTAVDNKKGPLGAIIYDEDTAQNLRDILKDLKSHPWKLLWKK